MTDLTPEEELYQTFQKEMARELLLQHHPDIAEKDLEEISEYLKDKNPADACLMYTILRMRQCAV
jgi:hypothetical protein